MANKLKNKRILVTGGNGYLGENICKKLISLGANVFIIDRKVNRNQKNEFKCNLNNYNNLKKKISKINPEYVIHLAAEINHEFSIELFEKMIKVNFLSTVNLYRSLVGLKKLKAVVSTGTCQEYGNIKTPFKEDQKENPESPYALSKVCVSHLSRICYNQYNLPILTLRLGLFYGPNQKGNSLIPSFLNAIHSNKKKFDATSGRQKREFNYIDDIVDAYVLAILNHKKMVGKIFNVGNGKKYRVGFVLNEIKKQMKSNIEIKFGKLKRRLEEPNDFFCNHCLFSKYTDWKPKTDLKTGIRNTIA